MDSNLQVLSSSNISFIRFTIFLEVSCIYVTDLPPKDGGGLVGVGDHFVVNGRVVGRVLKAQRRELFEREILQHLANDFIDPVAIDWEWGVLSSNLAIYTYII